MLAHLVQADRGLILTLDQCMFSCIRLPIVNNISYGGNIANSKLWRPDDQIIDLCIIIFEMVKLLSIVSKQNINEVDWVARFFLFLPFQCSIDDQSFPVYF